MELQDKNVLVAGLGKSGLAAALFLKRHGARVTVSDRRSSGSLAKEIPSLLEAGISVETGSHGLLTFRRQALIVVSPGVPIDTPELAQAARLGVSVIGELELACRFLQGKLLAITGSNGKTTTTSLCGEIFRAAGWKTCVAGNIGLPAIEVAERAVADGWTVLEVSSFQLETAITLHPQIAIILNITPDHLDRHGNMATYAAMKEKIFANQNPEDALVLNWGDALARQAAVRAESRIFWFGGLPRDAPGAFVLDGMVVFRGSPKDGPQPILSAQAIPLKGEHNVENVLAAVCAARLAGIPAETIAGAIQSFRAVEHRLEFVATVNGVDYYNDSKATNVDAAAKAIRAFSGNIHLILGGRDKNSDYSTLCPVLRNRVKAVYLIGEAAEKIEAAIAGAGQTIRCETLEAAMDRASRAAEAGDTVLLAPACSSFDQFENYEHRGRLFKKLVGGLGAVQGQGAWRNA